MTLPIENGETGLSARTKINELFTSSAVIQSLVYDSLAAPYQTKAIAAETTIPASVDVLVVLRYDTASPVCLASYRSTDITEYNTFPARLRFIDAGFRYWVLAEEVADIRMAGGVSDTTNANDLNNTQAMQALMTFFNLGDVGFNCHIGPGTYRWYGGLSPERSGIWSGVNDTVSILKGVLDPGVSPTLLTHATFFQRGSGNPQREYITFQGIKFEGDWGGENHTDTLQMNNGTGGRGQVFSLRDYTAVTVRDCTSDWSRRQAFVTRACEYTYWHNVKALHCGQSGINTQGALVTICTNCDFAWNGDDSINGAFDAAVVDGLNASGMIMILGCRFFQTLKLRYGASNHIIIANNVMKFTRTGAISSTSNGDSNPNHSLIITDNIIENVVDLSIIEPAAANNAQALVISQSKLPSVGTGANTVAAVPGLPDGSGNIISPYTYLERVGVTYPAPGQHGVIVSGNMIGRRVPYVSAYSDYNLGLWWTKDGWIDPAFTSVELQGTSHVGVSIGTVGRNVSISNNQIDGTYVAIDFTPRTLEAANQNIRVFDNLLTNFTLAGVRQENTGDIDIEFNRNLFDGDPDMDHVRHMADGTWDGFNVLNSCTGAIIGSVGAKFVNNTFRNVATHVSVPTGTVLRSNFLECDPVALGTDAANKGIRVASRSGSEWLYVIKGSNPSDPTTWNKVLNHCPASSAAMPTTGKWVEGVFVNNRQPVVVHGEFVLGWLRLTTGSGNVLDTDWLAQYVSVLSLAESRYALKDTFAIPAYMGNLQGTATVDPVGGINMPSVSLPDAVTSGVFFIMPTQPKWNNGTIARLKIRYTNIGVAANYFCRLRMRTINAAGGIGSWVFDQTYVVTAASVTNIYTPQTLTVGLDIDKGQGLAFLFEREGANGADTAANVMKLIDISLEFESDTPTAGAFDLPIT